MNEVISERKNEVLVSDNGRVKEKTVTFGRQSDKKSEMSDNNYKIVNSLTALFSEKI